MGINRELQQFEVDSDNDNVSEFTVGADKEIYINNSQVQAATAIVGNVLTLADAVTGRLEFSNLVGNNIYKQPTTPTSPLTNDVWSDTTTGIVKYYDGASWVNLSNDKAFFHATINPTGQSLPAGGTYKIAWNSVIEDNESKWSVINNQYEIPRDGKYLITILNRTQQTTNAGAGNYNITSNLYVNNSNAYEVCNYPQYFTSSGVLTGSRNNGAIIIEAIAGDLIDFRVSVNTNWASTTVNGNQTLQDFKIIEL